MTREELRVRLWPQTVVDFDHGRYKAISKFRDALGDSAENPRRPSLDAAIGFWRSHGVSTGDVASAPL